MALEYIHSKKVLHRDIRPDNVILSNGVVKLYDFSWATSISPKKAVFCGTVGYAPPEVSELNQYNESIDLWGLGVILYELATGRVWISSVEESLHNVNDGSFRRWWGGNWSCQANYRLIWKIWFKGCSGKTQWREWRWWRCGDIRLLKSTTSEGERWLLNKLFWEFFIENIYFL